ncbi:hypothetical protein [Lysobacter terrae]
MLLLSLLWAIAFAARAVTPAIVTEDSTNCLLRQDGSVSCWGYNGNGQADPPAGPFEQISMGTWSGCGLRLSGQVECWGGQNTSYPTNAWLDIPAGTYTQVDAGSNFHCAIRDDQKIVCWGPLFPGGYIPFPADDDHFIQVSKSDGFCAGHAIYSLGAPMCGQPLSRPIREAPARIRTIGTGRFGRDMVCPLLDPTGH